MRLSLKLRSSVAVIFIALFSISALAVTPFEKTCGPNLVAPNDPIWAQLVSKENKAWQSEGHNTQVAISRVSPTSSAAQVDMKALDCADVEQVAAARYPPPMFVAKVVKYKADKSCKETNDLIKSGGFQVQGFLCRVPDADEYRFWPIDKAGSAQAAAKIEQFDDTIRFKMVPGNKLSIVFDSGGEINAAEAAAVQ